MRWNGVKIDLNELARLRWIKNMTIPKICNAFGMSRSTIQASIRTMRKSGISKLNLTEEEKKLIESAIREEIERYNIRGVPK